MSTEVRMNRVEKRTCWHESFTGSVHERSICHVSRSSRSTTIVRFGCNFPREDIWIMRGSVWHALEAKTEISTRAKTSKQVWVSRQGRRT